MLIVKEEIKLSFLVGRIILYVKNHNKSTEKLLEQINKFSKVAEWNNTLKSIVFLHISKINMIMNLKIVPFKIVPKRNNIFRDVFNENRAKPVY